MLALSVEARQELEELIRQYARSIAHEANNLLFLDEILAHSADVERGRGELRRGLEQVRRDGRLIAQAFATGARRRSVSVGELVSAVTNAISKQASLRDAFAWNIPPAILEAIFREPPGYAQIVLQRLLEHNARHAGNAAAGMGVHGHRERGEVFLELTPPSGGPALELTPLAVELAPLGGFELVWRDSGAARVARLTLPETPAP